MIKVTAKIENEEPQIKDKECFFLESETNPTRRLLHIITQ